MTTASDAFTRANETPVASPWATVTPLGGLNLASNALTGVTDVARASLYNSGTWGNDQRVDVVVGNLQGGTRYAEAWVRGSTGGNGYKVYTDGTTGGTAIARMDAGSEVSLQAVAVAFAAADTLGIGIVGTTITLYKNGVAQTPTATDATYASGLPGAGAYGLATIDDWTADDGVSSATLEQEGARVGADDGSESAHTWLAAQDANATVALGTAFLVRLLVNGTGDPASASHVLRYQKNGAGGFVPVPVGANSAPALSYGAIGTLAYSAASGTSVAPAYPAGITTRSALIMLVGQKPTTANGGTVTTPSGWTIIGSITGANDGDTGGYTTTLAADTGNTNLFAYAKDTVSGSESGTLTVTVGDNNVAWAAIIRLQSSDDCTWSFAVATGKDTSAGSVSIATGNLAVQAGDHLLGAMVVPTDVTTPSQFSAEALSQTGTTFGTVTEIAEPDSTAGNDIGGFIVEAPVSSGSGSGAVTMTATAGGTTTNVRGPGLVLRARAVSLVRELYVAPSANIAAGGEATTARLTAPSGKTTADFITGRRWDDENGTDAIDITVDDYTELEWCLNTQAPATNGDAYQFRVYAGATALDTYAVTPQVTLSSGGSSPLPPARRRRARAFADDAGLDVRRARAPLAATFATNAQVLQLGGTAQAEQAGGAALTPGAVTLALGGSAERERAGGLATTATASLALGGVAEREQPGGLATTSAATATLGGNAERERTGGAALTPGAVTLQLGGQAEPERAGGLTAGAGLQTLQLGGTTAAELAGGLQAQPGAVTLALGGVAEAERAGGLVAGAGVQTIALGGTAEAERPGGAALTPGAVTLQLGGQAEREATGGIVVAAGAQIAALGGTAERERAGAITATPGTATVQLGGADERERTGGHQVVPGVVGIALGGLRERERAGGLVVTEGTLPVTPTWPAGGTARIGGSPLAQGGSRIGNSPLRKSTRRIG
jgi:hypothetical protein